MQWATVFFMQITHWTVLWTLVGRKMQTVTFSKFYPNNQVYFSLISKDQKNEMSRDIWFPTMWYVRPAKPQISLRICAVWPGPLLVAWLFYECYATDWTSFGVSKLERRLHMLIWVYTCQNATLLKITCHGSYTFEEHIFNLSTFVCYWYGKFWTQ